MKKYKWILVNAKLQHIEEIKLHVTNETVYHLQLGNVKNMIFKAFYEKKKNFFPRNNKVENLWTA